MKASDLLVRCLEAEGIHYVFGVPGEENADVMMSLEGSDIRFVLTPPRAGRGLHGRGPRPPHRRARRSPSAPSGPAPPTC